MSHQDAVFTGRQVVVTGAGRGIGSTIAASLATRGARVSLLGRSAENLHTVSRAIGGTSVAMPIAFRG